jgi:hypothetical protein
MKLRMTGIAAMTVLIGTFAANAAIVNYSANGWSQQFAGPVTPPANAPWGPNGYPGDTVALQSYNGTLNLTPGSSVQKVNTLLWTIDYTYAGTATDPNAWSDLQFLFNAARNMTIDGVGGTITQGGQLDVTWDNDYLGLSGGGTVSFLVQGYQVDVTPLALAQEGGSNFDGSNPWVQPSRDVMARFDITVAAVPEPTTVIAGALLLLPFGASTLRMLRKQRVA